MHIAHKHSTRLKSPKFKCGPPAVEQRYITTLSFGFTNCKSASLDSDLVNIYLVTSSNEGGITDFNDSIASLASIDFVAATDSNSDCNAASDIVSISTPEKLGVINSILSITASTSVSTLQTFRMSSPKFSSDGARGKAYSRLAYLLFQCL